MSGLVCITNDMHDIRSCTVKDQHAANCDGWSYRWNETHQRLEATGRECHGCLPRNARHGLLCLSCWEGVVQALSDACGEAVKTPKMNEFQSQVFAAPDSFQPADEFQSFLEEQQSLIADQLKSYNIGG